MLAADRLRLVTLIVALGVAPMCEAQDTPAPVELSEVVVTSQKMAQTLEQVPASVSALTGDQIRDAAGSNFAELQNYTANVTMSLSAGAGQYSIRGFGTPDTNTAFDPSVGTVVDGVYYGRSNFLAVFFHDVDRFEVLRGPQGTLFGKNNTAGVFNLVTEAPVPQFMARWELLALDTGTRSFRPVLNFPLGSSGWAVRLSGNFDHGDRGNLLNTTLQRDERNPQQDTVRARARYAAAGQPFTVDLGAFYSHQVQAFNEFQFSRLQPHMLALVQQYDRSCDAVVDHNNCENYPSLENAYAAGGNATIDWNLGHVLEARQLHLQSISGFGRITTPNFDLDADFSPVPFITDNLAEPRTFTQWTQELHLSGEVPSLAGWGYGVTFVFGAYYFQSHFSTSDFFNIQNLGAAFAYECAAESDANPGFPGCDRINPQTTDRIQQLLILLNPATGGAGLGSDQNAQVKLNQHARDYAVFGQAEHRITDEWSLIGGLRFDIETKDGDASSHANGQLVPLIADQMDHNTHVARIEHQLSPKAGFKWSNEKHNEAYATWTRGYKSGGFNALPLTPKNLEYDPEEATSIEIGGKVRALDGALRFSGALFTTDFDNLQVSTFQNNSFVVENAASARSRGFEADVHWLTPLTGFAIYASVGLADAKYKSYPNAPEASDQGSGAILPICPAAISSTPPCTSQSTQDLSGHPLSYAPKWTAAAIPSYELRLPRYMVALFAVDVLYRGQQFLNPDNDPRKLQRATTLVNGRVGVGDLTKNWKFTVVGHNLTDKLILDQDVDQPLAPGNIAVVRNDRGRYYSANLEITF